jgi:hypothetical protein
LEHEKVHKEEVALKIVIALKKRYRDQSLAVRRCSEPKK